MASALVAQVTEDRKLARWRATRDGALYACPHCWHGQREAGRCSACRRFDVAALGSNVPVQTIAPPPVPTRLRALEALLDAAREPKRQRRRRAQPLP